MRVSPDDRRNFGQFGLMVLAVGLVVAPLTHIIEDHGHGHPHPDAPAGPRPHTHHDGSIQHLTAVFSPPAAPPAVVQVPSPSWPLPRAPEQRAAARATFTPAMPQGP